MPPTMPKMPRTLIVEQLKYDLTPVAGLALVGHYLNAVQAVLGRLDGALPVMGGVIDSDIVRCYLKCVCHWDGLRVNPDQAGACGSESVPGPADPGTRKSSR